ncbi:ICOS ligand isoform X1 [Pyxicephalus adspersus]|uniref:ICOS ligand isoform X1 n=1 Tax=Pyxicephalus adspersus TaxID=30357 RepID=UPI003B5BEA3B
MTERSRWALFGVCSLIVLGSSGALKGRLRASVELPCELRKRSPSIENLLVYWQRKVDGEDVLVAEASYGKVITTNQHETYKGRASLSPSGVGNGDFTLHLSNLSLNDSGTFTCYVFVDSHTVIRLQNDSTMLHVTVPTADYSMPIITRAGPMEKTTELTLTCHTQGGAPQPDIRWINGSDGMPIQNVRIHNNIQKDDNFINVTSTISINVTSTTNFTCVILTASSNLTSNTYMMEVTDENAESESRQGVAPAVWNSVLPVVIVGIAVVVGMMVLKRRYLCPTGCPPQAEYQQGKAETNQM